MAEIDRDIHGWLLEAAVPSYNYVYGKHGLFSIVFILTLVRAAVIPLGFFLQINYTQIMKLLIYYITCLSESAIS
jgi:hypothetical protein